MIGLGYEPLPHQREAHERRKRFSVLVWHRGAGKTVFSVIELVLAAIRVPLGRYAYAAPFYRQAKAVSWEYLKRYVRELPAVEIHEADLAVRLPNGAEVRLFGADNPDSLRGLHWDGIVLDEVAQMRANVWEEIVRPALADRQGWALFIGTPKGVNLFSQLYQEALNKDDWYAEVRRASETGKLPAAELEKARSEMSAAHFAQEMDCDFSASSEDTLIPFDRVLQATKRDVAEREVIPWPRIVGVDVARYGDDRTVIARRQGPVAFQFKALRNLDTMEVAGQVAQVSIEWKPKAVFVDEGGVGAGVVDRLRQLGYRATGVNFGAKATRDHFENKRVEMWSLMGEWLKTACLPEDHELVRELTAPTYTYANARGRQQLESKDELRKRLDCSPDKADALALTFAAPVPMGDAPQRRSTDHERTWRSAWAGKERRV